MNESINICALFQRHWIATDLSRGLRRPYYIVDLELRQRELCENEERPKMGITGKAVGMSCVLSLKSQLRITTQTNVERLFFNTFFYNDREN